jgi:hypothetical protein
MIYTSPIEFTKSSLLLLVNEKTITALNRKESSQDEEVIFPGINTLTLFQEFPFDARKSLSGTLRSEVHTNEESWLSHKA